MPVSYGIIKKKTRRRLSQKLGNVISQSRSGAWDHHPMLPVSLFGIVSDILYHLILNHTISNHLNGRRWRYLSSYDTPSTRQSKLTTFQPLIWPVLAHTGAQHTTVGYPGWEAKNIQVGLVNLYQILTLRLSDKFIAFIIAEKSTVQIIIERSFFKHMTITPNEEKTHNDYWMVVSLAVDAHERC